MFNPLDLSNRKILVTGASSGIGRATAIYLSKLGATIIATARNEERLKETISMLKGTNHSYFCYDLNDLDNIEKIFEFSTKDGAKLDGMVHSAGIAYVMPLRILEPSKLQECFKSDFFCFVELVRQYSKNKYNNGGSIVAISSITSIKPSPCEVGYITAKSALNASMKSLALEISQKNIRINAILAGNVKSNISTNQISEHYDKKFKENEISNSLISRLGLPDEIASVCAFLLSDMASFITASLLDVSGGLNR